MKSSKCLQCGLVNFADAETCKRCGQMLSADPTGAGTSFNQTNQPPPTTFGAARPVAAAASSGSLWQNAGFRRIVFGVCWITGGLILTQFTSYIFYGAIIFGGIDVLRGCLGMFTDMDG